MLNMESEQNPLSPCVSESTFESERKKRKLVPSERQASDKKKSKVGRVEGAEAIKNSDIEKKDRKSKKGHGKKAPSGGQTPPYTWFLAIQISDPSCHRAVRKAQEAIIESHPVFLETMVPVSKSHITLFLFNLDHDGVTDAKLSDLVESIEKAVDDWRREDGFEDKIILELNEIGNFSGNRVVFFKPCWDSGSPFPGLWRSLATRLLEDGFITEKDGDLARFRPHVTICKMSRVSKKWNRVKALPRSFPREMIDSLRLQMGTDSFGQQRVATLQLLSMTKPPVIDAVTKGAYYHCHKEFLLHSRRPLPQDGATVSDEHYLCCLTSLKTKSGNEDAVEPSAPTSLFKGVAAMPLLLVVGGGLLALTIARHFIFRR